MKKKLVILAAGVLSAFALTACGKTKIDLDQYVELKYEGYDTIGTATYELDGNKLDVTFITSSGRSLEVCLAITSELSYRIESWKLTSAQVEEDTGDVLWTPSTAGD